MEIFFLQDTQSISWPHEQLRSLLNSLSVANGLYLALLAERLALTSHEVRILELLKEQESLATGEITALVSLSSGGATAVLDRLVRMCWVRRYPDPLDRRRICVQLLPERKAELSLISKQLFEEVLSRQTRLAEVLNSHFPQLLQGLQKQAQAA
ncbi:MAG: MarR family transcriptional regulator [Pigmentiphaga sp.]|nr:MarR family transcriptional regulator [Pigmentiphaga sp.]